MNLMIWLMHSKNKKLRIISKLKNRTYQKLFKKAQTF